MTANKRFFFRDFLAFFDDPPAFDKNNAEPAGRVQRQRQQRLSSTRSPTGSTTSSVSACSRRRGSRISTPTRSARTAKACRRSETLGVKSWMYTQGKIPGQDMLQLGLWNSGFTGTFYVDTPQISQDFDWTRGVAQRLVRRLVDAAELGWRRHLPGGRTVDVRWPHDERDRERQRRVELRRLPARIPVADTDSAAARSTTPTCTRPGVYVNDVWRVNSTNHRQRRPALGAVPRAEGPERVRHRLEP